MSGVSANLFPGTVRLCICNKNSAQSCIPCVLESIEITVCVYVAIRTPTEKTWFKVVLIKDVATRKQRPR